MRTNSIFILALASCSAGADSANSSDTEYIPDDVPSGNCGETDNDPCTSSGEAVPNGCEQSGECDAGRFCTALFDGDIGTFECRESCIADFDETRWCIDDAGCCSAGSICQDRGYCVPAGTSSSDSGTSESGTSESGTSESGTSGTGTSDTGTTDTGSTSGGALQPDPRPIWR